MVQHANVDGSTLLLIPAGNLTINPTLMPDLPFNVERDFVPICLLASAPNIIIIAPRLVVTSIGQLIAKAKTAKLSYGSPGIGSQLHLAMELFKEITGVDIVHVPYRGSPQALEDLLGGHIDIVASNLPAVISAIQSKLVVPLAMTTAQRSPLVPEVPTLAEAGVKGIDVTSWYGMLAPHRIPVPVRDAIFTVTRDILSTSVLKDKLLAQGLTVSIEPPDQFAARIARETGYGPASSRQATSVFSKGRCRAQSVRLGSAQTCDTSVVDMNDRPGTNKEVSSRAIAGLRYRPRSKRWSPI